MEKGQELHNEHVRREAHHFSESYEKWKVTSKNTKQTLNEQCSSELLLEHIAKVSNTSKNLNTVYEEVRHLENPDHDTRCRVDTYYLSSNKDDY